MSYYNKIIKKFNPDYIKVKAFNRSTLVKYHLRATVLPYSIIVLILLALSVSSTI